MTSVRYPHIVCSCRLFIRCETTNISIALLVGLRVVSGTNSAAVNILARALRWTYDRLSVGCALWEVALLGHRIWPRSAFIVWEVWLLLCANLKCHPLLHAHTSLWVPQHLTHTVHTPNWAHRSWRTVFHLHLFAHHLTQCRESSRQVPVSVESGEQVPEPTEVEIAGWGHFLILMAAGMRSGSWWERGTQHFT